MIPNANLVAADASTGDPLEIKKYLTSLQLVNMNSYSSYPPLPLYHRQPVRRPSPFSRKSAIMVKLSVVGMVLYSVFHRCSFPILLRSEFNAVIADLSSPSTTLTTESAPIRSVTVFRDKAEVTREAHVRMHCITKKRDIDQNCATDSTMTAEDGKNIREIVFKGLTKRLEPDSIQVSGEGSNFVIHEVRHELVMDPKAYTQNNKTSVIADLKREIMRRKQVASRIIHKKSLLQRYSDSTAAMGVGPGLLPLPITYSSSSPRSKNNKGGGTLITTDHGESLFYHQQQPYDGDRKRSSSSFLRGYLPPDEMGRVIDFYGTSMSKLDEEEIENEHQMKDLYRKIREVSEIEDSESTVRPEEEPKYNVYVTLEPNIRNNGGGEKDTRKNQEYAVESGEEPSRVDAEEEEEEKDVVAALLRVRYTVQGATWTPSYDLRVNEDSDENNRAEATLTYFGMVSQRTGEDWKNVHLQLSTATPSQAGLPPRVQSQHVTCTKLKSTQSTSMLGSSVGGLSRKQSRTFGGGGGEGGYEQMGHEDDDSASSDEDKDLAVPAMCSATAASAPAASSMSHALAAVETGFASQFRISKLASIESGKKPLKTCIGLVPMPITRTYYVAPAQSEKAFFHVSAKNAGVFPLLPSDDIRCFMSGNFVCKSSIPCLVSPGDTFQAFMGADNLIRVSYKRISTKERTEGGYLISEKRTIRDAETLTIIRNGRSHPIRIAVVVNVPRSDKDKVQVSIINPAKDLVQDHRTPFKSAAAEPEASTDWQHIRLRRSTTTGSLFWLLKVPPGTAREIPLQFTVSYPSDSALVTYYSDEPVMR